MAITITVYQLRPPEVQAVLWDKTGDTEEVAAWCGGRILSNTSTDARMQVPDNVEMDDGYLATMPCYIVKMDRRYIPMNVDEFLMTYTKKLV